MKKIFFAMLLVIFVACGSRADDAPPVARDDYIRLRDLGGLEIVIANWRGVNECTETAAPANDEERAHWQHRQEIEARHNFRVRYAGFGTEFDFGDFDAMMRAQDEFRDGLEAEIRVHNRDYTVWMIQPAWFTRPHSLFAPIPQEHFSPNIAWNESVWDLTMRGGVPHAFAHGLERQRPPGGGIYFNMRLFEAAGLPRDLPFLLQAEGNWTWDALTDAARQIGGDGEILPLVYTWSRFFFPQVLASNNTDFVVVDPESGIFVNATDTPEFLHAMEWLVQLRDKGLAAPRDEQRDGNARQMFYDERAAMFASSFVQISEFPHDEWGFVAFPKGPDATSHYSEASHNLYVIPYFFSPEEIDDIMFALGQWYDLPEFRELPEWVIEAYASHPDPRSVETMQRITHNPAFQRMSAHFMLPDTFDDPFPRALWDWNRRPLRDAGMIILESQEEWLEFLETIEE